MNQPEPTVKQVMSGDSIIIRGKPSGKPPPETTLNFSNISAPKLAKRPPGNTGEESKDEPWAWEAREFLRKRLIGKRIGSDLTYVTEKVNEREYHVVYFGKDTSGECLNKLLVKEGLVSLRPSAPAAYKELEEQAKTAGKGKFSKTQPLVREVRWVPTPASMQQLVDHFERKPIKTVIENVRDGSTVRCFVTMEDKTYHVTLLIAGIRCPGFRPEGEGDPPPFAHEAKYFVEIRLLQMDVEITLDAVQNNNIIGNIYHPKGNIAERLVEEGYAKCFDHTIQYTKNIEELRKLEKQAKNKGLRLWKNWQSSSPPIADADKGFTGTVIEIINGDGMKVKLANGTTKKIFLSSIRPPRMPEGENKDGTAPSKKSIRPLYDIPWMFEAREFLRKKLIRKKVNVTVDYIQPARDDLPAKTCCTVMVGQTNVAEALVSKGLATVIKNRQDDDQRSSQWDKLNAAQNKAMKSLNGLHGKKEEFPVHRVNDHSIDSTRAKAILPHIRRGNARIEGLVEYVASGSRLRLFLPKDSCLITLLLAGITCPRAPRQTPGGNDQFKDEDPFGQEALDFTREKVLQREVEFSIESLDKAGNFIGWLWYDNVNLSVALVQEGLCKIHQFSAGKSLQNYNALMDAEKHAKDNRINIWKDYKEEEEIVQPQEEEVERKVNHQKVVVIEVTDNLHIYVQLDEQTAKLEAMLEKMRKELQFALTGAYTPKKGDLCAAKFRGDNQWYRAKVEKVSGGKAKVFYVDYGNRDEVDTKDCATLPSGFDVDKPYAHEYALAYVKLVNDIDYQEQTLDALREDLLNGVFLLNVEYKINGIPHVTLVDPTTDADMVKSLVEQGYLLIDKRREKRLHQVVQDYIAAEEKARKAHKVIWEHGDITEDDDREFGMGRKER